MILRILLALMLPLTLLLAMTARVWADTAVTVATPILPSTIVNPYQGLSLPSILSTITVFDPLVVIDGKGRVQPHLAERWSSDDARVWRIALKEGVAFSTGRPVDADALVASLAHMQSQTGRTETVGSSLAFVAGIRALSPREVEVTLNEPDIMFPTRLALWKVPEPEGWARFMATGDAGGAIGSGPFMFQEISESRLVLATNPRARHVAPIDRLVLVKLPDQTARMQALLAGSADLAMQLGIENKVPIEASGGAFVTRRTIMLRYLAFATEHFKGGASPILDPRVRRAFNYAVNKQAIIDSLLDGTVAPVGQLVYPGAPGYDATLAPYPYDPDRAKKLLAAAGYAQGFPLTLRMAPVANDDTAIAQQIVADLRQIGVAVTIRPATQAQMTPLLFNAQLEAEMFFNFARDLDPLGDYRFRSCLGLTAGKPFFCDPDALAGVALARKASTFENASTALRDVIRREHENPPGIFLWETPAYDGFSARLPVPAGFGDDYDFVKVQDLTPK